MDKLVVGGRLGWLANKPEGTYFEITESGPMWIFNYAGPTNQELKDVSEGSSFEIRSMVLDNVLWVFVRCGTQDWAEAPYHPRLSRSPALEPITEGTNGYALTLILLDASTQTIKHMRLIGLGNAFSRALKRDVDALLEEPFSQRAYDADIRKAQMLYETEELVRLCKNSWLLR